MIEANGSRGSRTRIVLLVVALLLALFLPQRGVCQNSNCTIPQQGELVTQHFRIKYVTTGNDKVDPTDNLSFNNCGGSITHSCTLTKHECDGVPDFVQRVALSFEKARYLYKGWGYKEDELPQSEYLDSRYHVYIEYLAPDGNTERVPCGKDRKSRCYASHNINLKFSIIRIHSGLFNKDESYILDACAHEYYHAIQIALLGDSFFLFGSNPHDDLKNTSPWIIEGTAVWMANKVVAAHYPLAEPSQRAGPAEPPVPNEDAWELFITARIQAYLGSVVGIKTNLSEDGYWLGTFWHYLDAKYAWLDTAFMLKFWKTLKKREEPVTAFEKVVVAQGVNETFDSLYTRFAKETVFAKHWVNGNLSERYDCYLWPLSGYMVLDSSGIQPYTIDLKSQPRIKNGKLLPVYSCCSYLLRDVGSDVRVVFDDNDTTFHICCYRSGNPQLEDCFLSSNRRSWTLKSDECENAVVLIYRLGDEKGTGKYSIEFSSIGGEQPAAATSSTVLVIDTSESMNWDDPSGVSKIRAARTAATQFVNMIDRENETFGTDHQVALVTFNGSASILSPLTSDLAAVREKIANLSAVDGTNMYDGLSLANEQLSNSTGEPIILLLSDGVPTAGPPNSGDYKQHEEEVLSGPVREAMSPGYCIYAVGFGKPGEIVQGEPSIDPDFLNAVVQATGCAPSYYPATEASELLFTFVDMRRASMHREEVGRSKGTIQQGQSMDLGAITVPTHQKALYANLTWPGSQLDLILVDPRGREVNANYLGVGIGVYENMVYEIIEEPLSGTWKASAYGRDIPSGSTKFAFLASVEPAEEQPEEPPAEEPELGMLEIRSSGPIDLILKDPQGRIVSKEFPTVDGIEYIERFDASTDAPVDEITVPSRMVGDYQIRVLTEAGAERLQRFDLVATDGFDTVTLANRKFIIHAPKEPYVIRCTQEGFFDATGLPEEQMPEEKPTHDAGISMLTIVLIAAGSVTLIAGIIGILYFLRSRYYI